MASFSETRKLFMTQLIAVGVSALYAFIVTIVLLKVIDKITGLRIDDEDERKGLDISQHGERGYSS